MNAARGKKTAGFRADFWFFTKIIIFFSAVCVSGLSLLLSDHQSVSGKGDDLLFNSEFRPLLHKEVLLFLAAEFALYRHCPDDHLHIDRRPDGLSDDAL